MNSHTNHLLRVLGLAFGLAAVVGSVVGQGILRSPGIVAQTGGSEAVLIGLWALGALLALISALPYAELGAAMPNASGQILWTERAFGRGAGVMSAMALLVLLISNTALLCFVVGELLVRLGVGGGDVGAGALGIAVLLLFNLINAAGTRFGGGVQVALSTAKGVILIGLVIVLFAQPGTSTAAPSSVPVGGWLAFGAAILVIIGTYNGWSDVVFYGEEIVNPGRAVPRAIFAGIIGVAALYILVNLAILHVLSPAAMAASDFAAADASGAVFGARGDTVFTAFGVLSVAAIANMNVMTNSRLAFAMARDGMLPHSLTWVSPRGAPLLAMAATSVLSAGFLVSGTYMALSATSVSLSQALLVGAALAALALRARMPDLPRPYRAPFHPWPMLLALFINLGLLGVFIAQDPWNALLGFALVGLLSAVYWLVATNRRAKSGVAAKGSGETKWKLPN